MIAGYAVIISLSIYSSSSFSYIVISTTLSDSHSSPLSPRRHRHCPLADVLEAQGQPPHHIIRDWRGICPSTPTSLTYPGVPSTRLPEFPMR